MRLHMMPKATTHALCGVVVILLAYAFWMHGRELRRPVPFVLALVDQLSAVAGNVILNQLVVPLAAFPRLSSSKPCWVAFELKYGFPPLLSIVNHGRTTEARRNAPRHRRRFQVCWTFWGLLHCPRLSDVLNTAAPQPIRNCSQIYQPCFRVRQPRK